MSAVNCGNPDPSGFANGQRSGNSFGCQASVMYVCNAGYRLEGNSQRTCQGNGQWSGSTPFCRQCTQHQGPIHTKQKRERKRKRTKNNKKHQE